jgi:4-hydroxybenzoate polyprenyltransferase
MHDLLTDYARLLRLPGLGGLSIAPVFGAISTGILDLQKLAILFVIGACSAIYGFVLNDYVDVEVDRLSKDLSNRPLVKGTISRRTALSIVLSCFIGAFILIFLFFYRDHESFYLGFLCVVLAAVFGSIYNVYGKKIVGSDFLVALSEGLLVLFGAFMVIGYSGVLTVFTWVIFILTFNQLVFMNAVEGGLKDADHDYLLHVKNIALKSGVKVTKDRGIVVPTGFKIFGLGIRLFSSAVVFIPFVFYRDVYSCEVWHIVPLVLLVIGVLYLSTKLLNLKVFERGKIRRLIAVQTFLRYSFVPVMLIPLIGVLYGFILVVFPLVWYLVFTLVIGEKIFQPGI